MNFNCEYSHTLKRVFSMRNYYNNWRWTYEFSSTWQYCTVCWAPLCASSLYPSLRKTITKAIERKTQPFKFFLKRIAYSSHIFFVTQNYVTKVHEAISIDNELPSLLWVLNSEYYRNRTEKKYVWDIVLCHNMYCSL